MNEPLPIETLRELVKYKRYNRVEFFNPYPFQLKMFNAGKDHMARFACLGNRCG